MNKTFTGTLGALFAEYRKALDELIFVVTPLSTDDLVQIRDEKTSNPDCRSVQAILSHVIYAGYAYTRYMWKHLGIENEIPPKQPFDTGQVYIGHLNRMFAYAEHFFHENPRVELEETDPLKKISTRWGQQYDIEQLFEHAIVHVLKHRRQIVRFISA